MSNIDEEELEPEPSPNEPTTNPETPTAIRESNAPPEPEELSPDIPQTANVLSSDTVFRAEPGVIDATFDEGDEGDELETEPSEPDVTPAEPFGLHIEPSPPAELPPREPIAVQCPNCGRPVRVANYYPTEPLETS